MRPARRWWVATLWALAWVTAGPSGAAQDAGAPEPPGVETIEASGPVPEEGDYFEIPFEVGEGVAEIIVRHESIPAPPENILDWGILGPDGFRGYGGGHRGPAITGEEAASRCYVPGPITPGTWRVYVGKAKMDTLPGQYHVEIELWPEPTLDPQPDRAAYTASPPLSHEPRWYAGDFHVHSRDSGDAPAAASIGAVADFALARGLDFVMLSEHNTIAQLDYYADAQARHPMLLFVPGIEITTYAGHANAIGVTEWIDHRLGFQGVTAQGAADDTHAQGGLFSISHPVLELGDGCIGCAWNAPIAGDAVDAVEIQTGDYGLTGPLFFDSAVAFWEDFLAAGHHVAALGGSDDHRAGQGTEPQHGAIGSPTTMVWAEELSVDALMDGIRRGRTVIKLQGPDDPMMTLDAEGRDGDTVVGAEAILEVRVTDVPPAGATLRMVRNGVPGEPVEVRGDPFVHHEAVEAPARGEDWIRAELLVAGTPRVVTSHLFLRAVPGDGGMDPEADTGDGGCGCHTAGTEPGGAGAWGALLSLVWLGVLAAWSRRRRVR